MLQVGPKVSFSYVPIPLSWLPLPAFFLVFSAFPVQLMSAVAEEHREMC